MVSLEVLVESTLLFRDTRRVSDSGASPALVRLPLDYLPIGFLLLPHCGSETCYKNICKWKGTWKIASRMSRGISFDSCISIVLANSESPIRRQMNPPRRIAQACRSYTLSKSSRVAKQSAQILILSCGLMSQSKSRLRSLLARQRSHECWKPNCS